MHAGPWRACGREDGGRTSQDRATGGSKSARSNAPPIGIVSGLPSSASFTRFLMSACDPGMPSQVRKNSSSLLSLHTAGEERQETQVWCGRHVLDFSQRVLGGCLEAV